MQTKFLVRSFLVLAVLALGTAACGGTTPTADEGTDTNDAATETSGSESSDDTTATTTDDTTDDATDTTTTDADAAAPTDDVAADDPADDTGDDAGGDDTGGDDAGDIPAVPADTTAPSVTAKSTIPADTALSGVSTLVAENTAFLVTFSETVTGGETITEKFTLACGNDNTAQTIAIGVAADTDGIENNEFSVTPAATLPSGTTCTLDLLAGIADSVGNATTETTTFAVKTCGLTDDFSDTTSLDVCWTAGQDNEGNLTASVADGAATFSIDVGTTEGVGPTLNVKNVEYVKTITVDDFVLQATFTSLAGLKDSFDLMNGKADGTFLIATTVTEGEGAEPSSILCGPVGTGDGSGLRVLFLDQATFTSTLSDEVIGAGTGSGALVVRLSKAGDTSFVCEYSTDSANGFPAESFVSLGGSIDQPAFETSTATDAGLFFIHTGDEELKAVVDDLSFSVEEAPVE